MPARGSARARGWRIDLFVVLAVLALTAPFLREWSTQPASRYLFTASLVDDHTLQLDRYKPSLGADLAIVNGHVYSDKAPYQPVLAVPVYWLYRTLGGERFPDGLPATQVQHRFDIGLWLVTLWSSTLPACILAVLLRRHAARWFPRESTAVALALLFGTVLLPFSALLFGHVLAATVGFAAWFLLRRPSPTTAALVGAGALLGAGAGVEYPQVLVAVVLGTYALVAFRTRAVWVALGGIAGLVPLLLFNAATFGGPFKTAYQGYLPNFQGSGAFGVYNLVLPDPQQLVLALVGDRGLFSLTLIMVMAVAGGIRAIRQKTAARPDAIVAFVLLGLYVLVSTGIDGYGGSSPGPRYLVPIIPFFALPLAEAWRKWRPLCIGTALWSAFWMSLATMTDVLYQEGGRAQVDWLNDLVHGRFERSLPGAVLGDPAILVMAAIAAGCAYVALRLSRTTGTGRMSPEQQPAVEAA